MLIMEVTLNNIILKEIIIVVDKIIKKAKGLKKTITTEKSTSNQ